MQPEKRIKESLPEPGDIMGRAMSGENGGAMSNKMPKERLTEDLLARLLNSKSPEDYLSQGETIDRELPDYLFALLDAKGMNRSQVARISSINTTFLYNIFEGKSKPKRDNALMLAFALEVRPAPNAAVAAPCRRCGAVAQGASRRHHHMVHRTRLHARGMR